MAPPDERLRVRPSQRLSGAPGGRAPNLQVATAAHNPAPAQVPWERAAAALVASGVRVEAAARSEADGNLRTLLAAANANVASFENAVAGVQQLILQNRTISEAANVIVAQVAVNVQAAEEQFRQKQAELEGAKAARKYTTKPQLWGLSSSLAPIKVRWTFRLNFFLFWFLILH